MLNDLLHDLTFAGRLLRRHRLPTVMAGLCLALGIGATTTMFSIGRTLLAGALPYPSGDRLVEIFTANDTSNHLPDSYLDMRDWRERSHSFAAMGAIGQWDYILGARDPQRISGGLIASGFFEALGVTPEAGRLFAPAEDEPGAARVALVSHSLAERLLGGATRAVGQQVSLSGEPVTIVGVIPDRWRYPSRTEIWVPVARLDRRDSRGWRSLEVIAALKPGATLDAARRDLAATGAQLSAEYPVDNADYRPFVQPLRERYIGPTRASLAALAIATLLVLLVACVNAAGLQLARAAQRTREIALRVALGAARGRIARQLLAESVMLSVCAAALGVALATWGTAVVSQAVAAGAPVWMRFGLDGRALAFTVALAVIVGLSFGVVPSARLATIDPASALKGGLGVAGLRRGSLQRAFVVAEVALSLMLLTGAGLAGLSVYRLQHVSLGFDPEDLLTFRVLFEGPQYDVSARRVAITSELVRRLGEVSGVSGAAASDRPPALGCCSRFSIAIEGQPNEAGHLPTITGNVVSPGYFRTLDIPVLDGRDFATGEGSDSAPVAIVSAAFSRTYWPETEATGHRIKIGSAWARVVGVVGDVRQNGLADAIEPQVYLPHQQERWASMTYIVRARSGNPMSLLPAVRDVIKGLDPAIPLYGERTITGAINNELSSPRTIGALIAGFGIIALVLATAGIYAVMAFFVSQRAREIGVRIALGAERSGVQAMVIRQGIVLGGLGAVIGLGGSWVASRVLIHAFYGVGGFEPLPYLLPAVLLLLTAVAASYVPAVRASQVDPTEALRAD